MIREGGQRKPALHPELSAWNTVRDSLAGKTGPVVAACICGQPLLAEGDLPATSWTTTLPDAVVSVEAGADIADLDKRVNAAYREPFRPFLRLFEVVLMWQIVFPIALWAMLLSTVLWILYNVFLGGADMGR